MKKTILSVYGKLKPFIKKINSDNIFAIAGQSAFFLILSSVPLLMFGVSLLQNMHIPEEALDKVFAIVFNEAVTKNVSSFISNPCMCGPAAVPSVESLEDSTNMNDNPLCF